MEQDPESAAELEEFPVLSDPSSIELLPEHEGTNASRFAIMATLGAGAPRLDDGEPAVVTPSNVERFGIDPELAYLVERRRGFDSSFAEAVYLLETFAGIWSPEEVRYGAFRALNEDHQIAARLPLLAAGLSSPLERESATAASALRNSVAPIPQDAAVSDQWRGWPYRFMDRRIDTYRLGGPAMLRSVEDEDGTPDAPLPWEGDEWRNYCTYWLRDAFTEGDPSSVLAALHFLAAIRTDLALRSADPIVRELGRAATFSGADGGDDDPQDGTAGPQERSRGPVSTMVHGTWGWKGNWWYPGGDFHGYVQQGHRPDLYDDGQEFSWSGAYSKKQRHLGGQRFGRWARSAGGAGGLGTVFGHSYGGEIVARAVNAGTLIDEVVLLSAPIHGPHRQMVGQVRRVLDVRLDFDIVLTAACAGQRLPPASNIIEHRIARSFWSHAATHNPTVWRSEGIAVAIGL
ncbi:hypothetical protein [Arthrobacter sp.]|uniref:hypothetical protein n=1 Tax=Arthrobacter sp. TaxID=1667 RepID=UPI003A94EACE